MKKIEDLRDRLFDTIDALSRPENPMEIDRARAIAEVGKVIVDSAKVEVDFARATGKKGGTGFIPFPENPLSTKPNSAAPPRLAADNRKGYTGIPRVGHG